MNKRARELMNIYHKQFNAELKYSTISEQFYVSGKVDIKEGCMLKGICEHRDTPEEAVMAFHNVIERALDEGNLKIGA